jgi:hypothetical protein
MNQLGAQGGFISSLKLPSDSNEGRKYSSSTEARKILLDALDSQPNACVLVFDGLASSQPLKISDEQVVKFLIESARGAVFELSERGLPLEGALSFVFVNNEGTPIADVYLIYSRFLGAMTLADLVVEGGAIKSRGTYQLVDGYYAETANGYVIKENLLRLDARDREMFALLSRGIAELTRKKSGNQ